MAGDAPKVSTARIDDALLDAACHLVTSTGGAGVSMTQIARQAEVSRMTLYRRAGSLERLLVEATDRELRRTLRRAQRDAVGQNAREQLVSALLSMIRNLAENPFYTALMQAKSGLLTPYLTDRAGRFQHLATAAISDYLLAGYQDKSIAVPSAGPAAYALLVTVQAFVISHVLLQEESNLEQVHQELAVMLDAYLGAPRVQPGKELP